MADNTLQGKMVLERNDISEITISLPLSVFTEDEQLAVMAIYIKKKTDHNGDVLPTAINTDDEKMNFTYNVADSGLADIHDTVNLFTDVTMKLTEKARQEAQKKVDIKKSDASSPVHLSPRELLKIRSQILSIRAAGKYNMFDIPAVQREAYELHFYELVVFIEEHKADYTHFILTGDLPGLPISLYPIEGSKVMLDEMPNDPYPVPVGTVGTVEGYDDLAEILMSWQTGSRLKLIPGVDRYHVVG